MYKSTIALLGLTALLLGLAFSLPGCEKKNTCPDCPPCPCPQPIEGPFRPVERPTEIKVKTLIITDDKGAETIRFTGRDFHLKDKDAKPFVFSTDDLIASVRQSRQK